MAAMRGISAPIFARLNKVLRPLARAVGSGPPIGQPLSALMNAFVRGANSRFAPRSRHRRSRARTGDVGPFSGPHRHAPPASENIHDPVLNKDPEDPITWPGEKTRSTDGNEAVRVADLHFG